MKSDILQLNELVVGRDGMPLLAPLHQQFTSGDIVSVAGPNGLGKSSFLKTLAGLLPPYSGQVLWNQAMLTHDARYPRMISYLGHQLALDPVRTVEEQLQFWARAYGQPELLEAALHFFDLSGWQNRPLYELSAGWRQRVALARLIVQPGTVWLLDEPASHLDVEGLKLLNALVETRAERGGLIFIASHALLEGKRIKYLVLEPYSSAEAEAA